MYEVTIKVVLDVEANTQAAVVQFATEQATKAASELGGKAARYEVEAFGTGETYFKCGGHVPIERE